MPDIVNPYIAGSPVTGPEMFFGREDVFKFIQQTLIGQHRDNVIVLYGQRRTGKTSVLYQMRTKLGKRYLCIFIDLHGLAIENLSGFLWELANHIMRVLRRDYKVSLPNLNRDEFLGDPRSYFENDFLNQVWLAIGDLHVLLMLDEAIRLEEQVLAGRLDNGIFEFMRHLMQHYEQLNFLFSIGSGLEVLEKEYTFLFNVGLYKKISFLDWDSTRDLITKPVKDYYQFEPETIERIYRITSGHPYYTQLICHCLFNRWQRHNVPRIEMRNVEEILDEAMERGLAVLKHVWEESTPGEKAIMAGMVAAMDEQNCQVDVDAINLAWRNYDVVIPQSEIANATRSLIAREVLSDQGKYEFTVDLQRLWVQKYRRIEWVKAEIVDAIQVWLPKPITSDRGISRRSVMLGLAGLVVVAGGVGSFIWFSRSQSGPNTGKWSPTGRLLLGRKYFTATTLNNGLVLIEGGSIPASITNESETFNPQTGVWTSTGQLSEGRVGHTATLLRDGKVLVAGGSSKRPLNSAELYDPTSKIWKMTGSMNQYRDSPTATLLLDGKVLVAGGWSGAKFPNGDHLPLDSAELYDPATESWSPTGKMVAPRQSHVAVLMPDGKVLVIGGINNVFSTELYNPSTNSWTATKGHLHLARAGCNGVLLPDRKRVLVIGGGVEKGFTNTAEIYDVETESWSLTNSMKYDRSGLNGWKAVILRNGTVLVPGGDLQGTSEIFDPASDTWLPPLFIENPPQSYCESAIALLADGRVLIAGGTSCGSDSNALLTSCDIYTSE